MTSVPQVESIIDSKEMVGGVIMYKVHWKGFTSKHDSWLPANEMNCENLVSKYEATLEKLVKTKDWVVRCSLKF